jgi:hypothetical protein
MDSRIPLIVRTIYEQDPVLDDPKRDADYISKFPEYGYPNVWPKDLPELKMAFQEVHSNMLLQIMMTHQRQTLLVSWAP